MTLDRLGGAIEPAFDHQSDPGRLLTHHVQRGRTRSEACFDLSASDLQLLESEHPGSDRDVSEIGQRLADVDPVGSSHRRHRSAAPVTGYPRHFMADEVEVVAGPPEESSGTGFDEWSSDVFVADTDLDAGAVFDPSEFEHGPVETGPAPSVVAVVSTAGGDTLERCVEALQASDYPELTVLVVDHGDDGPALGARLAAIDPRLPVLRIADDLVDVDPADRHLAVVNATLATVQGAPLLAFVRDDVVLQPMAIRAMVTEVFRSNAAIVGPKLVDADDPGLLVDVGGAIDHYGTPFSPIEPGERDQEQHDAVRDVFFVTLRACLVRADLLTTLGGVDLDCGPAADVDLAWRARLLAARVLVVPDAVGAVVAGRAPRRAAAAPARVAMRARVRVLVKNYGLGHLVWVLPTAFVFSLAEALVHLVRRRPDRAGAMVRAWLDAIAAAPSTWSARSGVQAARTVDDAEISAMMVRGNARARELFERRLHVDDRIVDAGSIARDAIDDARRFRHAEYVCFGLLIALLLLTTRGFVTGGVPGVGGMASWPSPGTLLRAFLSGHQHALLGARHASPAFDLVGASVGAIALGHVELVRTLIVVLAGPIGAVGVYRLLRPTAPAAWAAVAGVAAYGAAPVLRNAIVAGELGGVLVYAVAPWLLVAVVGRPGTEVTPADRVGPHSIQRRVVGIALATAVLGTAAPAGLLLPLTFAGAVGIAVALGRGPIGRRGAPRVAALGTLGAGVLLLPQLVSAVGGGASAFGLAPRPVLTLTDLASLRSGPSGAGWLVLGVLIAALLPLVVAGGDRLRAAALGWLLVLGPLALVFVTQHLSAATPLPEPSVLLAIAALGAALAVGAGIGAVADELRTSVFGVRQIAVVIAIVALVAPMLTWMGDLGGGRVRASESGWGEQLGWLARDASHTGELRVLWLGAADVLPVPGVRSDDVSFTITRNGAGDVRDVLPIADDDVSRVGDAVTIARHGGTARLGHLLAPLGIKYVALVDRPAPGSVIRRPGDARDSAAMADQLDLTVLDAQPGLRLYQNLAWAPVRSLVPESVRIPTGPAAASDPVGSALTTDISAARRLPASGGPGTIYVAESASDAWSATLDGTPLRRVTAFGWANGWSVPRSGRLAVTLDEPVLGRLVPIAQIVAWIVAIGAVIGVDRLRRGRRRRPEGDAPESADESVAPSAVDDDAEGVWS